MRSVATVVFTALLLQLPRPSYAVTDDFAQAQAELETALAPSDITWMSEEDMAAAPESAWSVPPDEKVDSDRVLIVGRGIKDRKTGDSMALGCINTQCTELRVVYFKRATREAVFTGQVFFIPHAEAVATASEIKSKLKRINKDYRRFKRSDDVVEKRRTYVLGYAGACFVLCGMFALPLVTKGAIFASSAFGAATMGFSIALPVVLLLWLGKRPLFGTSGMVSTVFADQNGWNWTDRPKRVSSSTFDLFRRFALNQHIELTE